MASVITLDGGTGLFDKLGAIAGRAEEVQTAMTALLAGNATILGKYAAADTQWLAGGVNAESAQMAKLSEVMRGYQQDAETTLIEMVHAAIPLPTKNTYFALRALIDDMTQSSESVKANTVSAGSVTAGRADGTSNSGSGTVIASVTDEFGQTMEYLPAGTIYIECVEDAQLIGRTGNEAYQITSQAARDGLDSIWPGGAGISARGGSIAPAVGAATGIDQSVLDNGDLDLITANVPNKFTATAGSAGTDFLQEASAVYVSGGKALKFVGDGSTLVALEQTINSGSSATGTLGRLLPRQRYVIGCYLKHGGTLGAGTARLSVKDGSNTILDSGSAAVSIAFGGITGSYTLNTATFKTPDQIPSGVKFVNETTVAVENTRNVYMDELFLAPMRRASSAGPFVSVVRGATLAVARDRWRFTISNNWGGKFQKWFERFYGIGSRYGLHLPSATGGGQTIDEALVA